MSSNSVGRDLAQRLAHALRLELEDADRVAAGEHLEGLGVVERDRLDVDLDPARAADDLDRVLDHVEVAQAEEVHLQQADLLDRAHRVLGDDLVLALGLAVRPRSRPARRGPRRAAAGRSRAAGGRRSPPRRRGSSCCGRSPRAPGDVDDLARVALGVVGLAQLLARLQALVEARAAAHDRLRDQLRDPVAGRRSRSRARGRRRGSRPAAPSCRR